MTHTKRIASSLVLAVALACYSQLALALGLGNAKVDSYLNQPLIARIDLITNSSDDLGSISARLASAEDFALIGASRDAISVPLRFEVVQTAEGASIRVTSNLPVKEPVVRLIVEVNWASGRMLREYTLFLDPPVFDAPAPAPVVDQRAKTPVATRVKETDTTDTTDVASAESAPEAASETRPPAEPGQPAAQPTAEPLGESGDEYGPVQNGETLWRIASDWSRGTGLDINSVMVAIQRNNPGAFISNNINLLKRGAILRMPQMGEIAEISSAVARSEVIDQSESFSRGQVTAAVETPLVDESSAPQDTTDAVADEPVQDQLELVPPSAEVEDDSAYGFEQSAEKSDASTGVQTLREQLARKEEELISEQQENSYLQDRINELEGRLASQQEGSVDDAGLAQVEEQLRQDRLSSAGFESEPAADVSQPEPIAPAEAPRAEVPRVTTSGAGDTEEPWYRSWVAWLIGLLVLGGAIAGWFMSRRGADDTLVSELGARRDDAVREMKDEAEEILKVLKPSAAAIAGNDGATLVSPLRAAPRSPAEDDEAELLDEDSADPEVRLDLARAYISMGDKEAARVVLDEVMEHGDKAQQAEAKEMLKEL